jgi:hypothetical protein
MFVVFYGSTGKMLLVALFIAHYGAQRGAIGRATVAT